MEDFTGVKNQSKSLHQVFCSTEFARGIHYQLFYLVVLNIILSVTAFLENKLILVAFHKESSLHPPTKLLFRCLATTDLCVGLISQRLTVIHWTSLVNERWNLCRHTFVSSLITGYVFSLVSLLTLSAISVDGLLALLLGLRYRQVVTLKKTCSCTYVLDYTYSRDDILLFQLPNNLMV